MRRIFVLLFAFCQVTVFVSCTNGDVNSNEQLSIADPLHPIAFTGLTKYDPFNTGIELIENDSVLNRNYTAISYINVSCPTCIEEIDKWAEFYKEVRNEHLNILLIFFSKDRFEYIMFLIETGVIKDFPFPFYLDETGSFSASNPVFNDPVADKTLLIDKPKRELIKGNPLHKENIKQQYLEILEAER